MAHSAGQAGASGSLAVSAIVAVAVTAAGTGDSTTANGKSIDTGALGARYNAAALVIGSTATIASGESLAVTALIQDSANNSDWATLVETQVAYSQAADGGALTAKEAGGVVGVDLSKAGQYIRAVLNPDMSRGGTDTANVHAIWIFQNPDKVD
jgi:hypothetical protein